VIVRDVTAMPWEASRWGGPPGIVSKTLWEGGPRGPLTKLTANVPLFDTGAEFHECPEECFVLGGDVTGKAGAMTAGCYFWRPEYVTHGPFHSESGLLVLLRGHGELYAHWHDQPDATPDENRAYLERLRADAPRDQAGAETAA
jgi:hypothetical protein